MTTDNLPRRMWINQPSTSQPNHPLHGVRVYAIREDENTSRVYFLKGPVIDQQISTQHLSEGWPPNSRTNPKHRSEAEMEEDQTE